jgi:predicted metal-dependent enzyme (double-stranded beta helix superfamily)
MPNVRPTSINPASIAAALAARPQLWRPFVRYDAESRYYARLASEPHYEAWLLTWLPGQGTDWHDHGGSAGAFTVVQGELTERYANKAPEGTIRIRPGATRLATGKVRPFGVRHIHRVTNDGVLPAVSLHVYAPALLQMHAYAAQGEVLELVTAQLAGVNW